MRPSIGSSSASLALLIVLGCGGKAVIDGSSETGAGASGGTGGTGATTTSTSATTTTTTTGSGGAGGSCGQTHDRFEMQLVTYDNQVWGCTAAGTQMGQLTLDAAVTGLLDTGLMLDSCPPNADCMPMMNQLTIAAPGMAAYIMEGTFVELRLSVDFAGEGCSHQLEIWNLPTWGGVNNPGGMGSALWLAAADGVADTISHEVVTLTPLALGCYPGAPSCGTPKDDFVLRLAETCAPDNVIDVGMGQSPTWQLFCPEQPPLALVRNLRSYESGLCDDYGNWAFYYDATYGIN